MDKFLTSLLAAWVGFIGGIITMLVLLAAVLSLSSCVASHPSAPDMLPALSVQLRPDSLAALPPFLVPAPAGSTPRQRRQWQKAQTQNLARAGVLPAKVKNSSVATAPGATSINRPTSAVAIGSGAATDARKAGQRGGASAVGPGAVATSTSAGASWWWYVLAAVAGAVGWEVLTSQVTPLRLLLKWRASA
ncbi:MAG: hypothetical protein ACRYF0_17995 [Janthinobacterium lividum]